MSEELRRLIAQVARIRSVDVAYVYDALKNSILAGLRRRFGRNTEGEVEIDEEKGEIKVFIYKNVVKQKMDPIHEVTEEEAKKIKPDAKEGDKIKIEIPLLEIGRVAIQKAVDELTFKLREAEKTKLFNEFIKKKHDIITGTIHKIDKDEIIVNLGPVYGVLPQRDQMKVDHYHIGAPFKFYVVRIEKTPIGPRIYLSRTHPEFLKKLLEKEVPEIQEGIVEIKAVARIPGVRSKVAVYSNDDKVDPIGACVGYRKTRIQNVMKELSGEKIDVIQWSKEPKVFVARAMSPAKIIEVIEEEENVYTVVVPDEEYSKAIGKKGQNVWLASLLTQTRLEVMKETDYKNRLFAKKVAGILIKDLDFIEEEEKERLINSGYTTVVSIFEQPATEIAKNLGIEISKVEELKSKIREKLESEEA